MVTPAAKNANTGMANPDEIGRIWCSKCSARPGPSLSPASLSLRNTGTVNPNRTPATVAWIPDSWTNTHVIAASGISSHQVRIRRCTRTANRVSGISAISSAPRLMWAV